MTLLIISAALFSLLVLIKHNRDENRYKTGDHNRAEAGAMADLFERERQILGKRLGRDPRKSAEDMKVLELRVAEIILDEDFGAWLAEEVKKRNPKN